jgi:HlyD family secretion protein
VNRKYFNWILLAAALGAFIVGIFMHSENPKAPPPDQKDIILRPVSPFRTYISGVGIIEASSENIFIGSPVNRVVDKVEVSVGEKVKAGQVLFRLEARDLEAELSAKKIAYENAIINLQKLEALPRTEDLHAATAELKGAEIALSQASNQYQRVEGLQLSGAMSAEEVMHRKFAFEDAEAKFQKTEADFNKIKAGAWLPDLEIAKLQIQLAEADEQRIATDIKRTVITSPIDATVLQIKIHEGEYPPSDSSRSPPMIIGNTDIMHIRVNINQYDASYFDRDAPAIAFLQGNADLNFPLKFVRLEPIFVTKQNLTNDISEKIDTRVLQAIYALKEGKHHIYVGQQMDVFIETHPELAKE